MTTKVGKAYGPLIFFTFVLFVTFVFGVPLQSSAEDKEHFINYGIIVFVKGKGLLIDEKGKQKAIKKGDKFYKGSKIVTQTNSFVVIRTSENTTVKIDPESEVMIADLIEADTQGYSGVSQFILKAGGAMLDVVKIFDGPPTVKVKTRKGVEMGVRGTLFYIFDEVKTGHIWTTVKNGKVWVWDEALDDYEEIEANKSVVLLDGITLTSPQKWKWTSQIQWPGKDIEKTLDSNIEVIKLERSKELDQSKDLIQKRKKKSFKELMEKSGFSEEKIKSSAKHAQTTSLGGTSSAFESSFPFDPEVSFPEIIDSIGTTGGQAGDSIKSVVENNLSNNSDSQEEGTKTPPLLVIQNNNQSQDQADNSDQENQNSNQQTSAFFVNFTSQCNSARLAAQSVNIPGENQFDSGTITVSSVIKEGNDGCNLSQGQTLALIGMDPDTKKIYRCCLTISFQPKF